MRRNVPRLAAVCLFLCVAALTACTSATRSDEGASRQDVLTREQIMGVSGVSSLYEVVQRLRPRWLEARGGERSFGLSTEIVVYQNQSFLGGLGTLEQLSPDMAYQLRWLDGATASATLPGLGSRHVAGAIVISTSPPDNE
ncbi:MAG TPA: hypothetical protein VFU06_16850 [Longimicrobiales bacterium]|nr:hypothetical protein [Longimicrobiales bacterium]